LSTTSKLSQQEIVKAVNNQLEELKILKKGLMPALPGGPGELKAMEAKSREIRDEISKLREKIVLLESEEKGILSGIAAREKEMELVEKAVGDIFTDIGEEITLIKKKVEEFTAVSAAPQAAPQPVLPTESIKSDSPSEEKGGGEQKSESIESSVPLDTEWQKKCPMCGGRMNFHIKEEMWMCYSCAYEESKKDESQGKGEEKRERANALKPNPASEPILDPSPPFAVPLTGLSSNEYQEPKKSSSQSNNQPSSKKKACPVCHKKMDWYQLEKAWRCPSCEYERRI